MISIQWYADEFIRKRRIIVYGSVTRYGPRTSCQRKELNWIVIEIMILGFISG